MKKEGLKLLSFTQIFILIVSLFSIAFIISESQTVTADGKRPGVGSPGMLGGKIDSESVKVAGSSGSPSEGGAGAGIGSTIAGLFTGKTGGAIAPLLTGLTWGATIAGVIQLAKFVGLEESIADPLSIAALAGGTFGGLASQLGASLGLSIGVGIGVAAIAFVLLYKKEAKKVVEFQCLPFEAPLGGADCDKCNSGILPCSEYRCKSLGQACEIVNAGSTEEACVWVSRDDVNSPLITPLTSALSENHRYTNHQTRPPSLGTKIVRSDSTNGCLQPFTPLEFGFSTNEPAQCKIGLNSSSTFDEMTFFFGENSLLLLNHSQRMRLPSPAAIAEASGGEFILGADGNYDFYVRCRDANGNTNEDVFAFNFCVDPAPDTTPPIIEDTSVRNGQPVSAGTNNLNVSVYTNEPAECRWSILDKAFQDMENPMSCSTEVYQLNARDSYECEANLNGLKDRQENVFYFRCKDQPTKAENERNVNGESYRFSLFGSQPLNILEVSPNSTIFDNTDFVRVELKAETANGVNEGEAVCYFSPSGEEGTYIEMFETSSFVHNQILSLAEGDYTYSIRCVDEGGNSDTKTTSFRVETDEDAPRITRAYKEGVDSLKIVTDENAKCSYSLKDCNFEVDLGIEMRVLDSQNRKGHYAKWEAGNVYYIRCMDEYGNSPAPNSCSLKASASAIL